jgi:hypothetical protein
MTDFNIVEATNDNFEGYDGELSPMEEEVEIGTKRKWTFLRICLVIAFVLAVVGTAVHLATEIVAWGIVALASSTCLVILSGAEVIRNWYG